jgi:hypothetical protein
MKQPDVSFWNNARHDKVPSWEGIKGWVPMHELKNPLPAPPRRGVKPLMK